MTMLSPTPELPKPDKHSHCAVSTGWDPSLMLGDCLERMAEIPDGSVDMVCADLPYGTTACKWDTIIPFEPLWEQYKRIIKDNGAIVLTASQPFTSALVMSNVKMFKYCWYWRKERGTNFATAKYMPMKVVEECVVFSKNKTIYNPELRKVKPYKHVLPFPKDNHSQHLSSSSLDDNGERIYKTYDTAQPVNVLEIPRDNMYKNGSLHPTQKPVALMEYLIRTYTNEGQTVLDNTMGSGTTGVACAQAGRRFIGIERDEGYFAIARQRIESALSALANVKDQGRPQNT
jgi:site-specific DNA-methyltransferase (adenine-specific)